ncbi:MAG: formylmethanofuran dehydrogenase subunit B [Candidatus Syntrophoarchaeum sp. WYZ-LMO15]|nr:MAG: formylmethanofuran dehydrogenase subunit B [Candidatus Syntrophoarchaeum sp. WYZ-LMO15]
MSTQVTATCPGCSCLCDDIEVVIEESEIREVGNACRKGASLFLNADHPAYDLDAAIDEAIEILKNAKSPAIFGLDNTTIEAQRIAIKISEKLGCMIEDYSSIRYGDLLNLVISSRIKTCTLDDVRDRADISIFWGSDAMSSQPRHLSRFSYFPRGEHKQKGWEFDRYAISIDIYRSPTAKVCREFLKVSPGQDPALMDEILGILSGKPPGSKELLKFSNEIKKADFGVIFAGSGLIHGLNRDMDKLIWFMEGLNEYGEFYLIPMVKGYNMRGFVEMMKRAQRQIEGSFLRALLDGGIDAALIVGADPMSDLPYSLSKKLLDIQTIVIDPRDTPTTEIADLVIHTGIAGVDNGGSAMRMDGVEFELVPCIERDTPSDEAVLTRILEGL